VIGGSGISIETEGLIVETEIELLELCGGNGSVITGGVGGVGELIEGVDSVLGGKGVVGVDSDAVGPD
jgi:hypothetical protein